MPPETLSVWNIPDSGALALGSYPPAILDGGHTSMEAAQDESFGPPLAVESFRADQEAITLANHRLDWPAPSGRTMDRVHSVAAALQHGTVWINDNHLPVPDRAGRLR